MSQIDGESGADESGGEGEWRVWREADLISGLMSKAGKRAKESHSPCPQCIPAIPGCLCSGDNLAKWEDSLQSTRLRLTNEDLHFRLSRGCSPFEALRGEEITGPSCELLWAFGQQFSLLNKIA